VETAGIEPASATLAGRARSLAVIPKIPVLAAAERDGAGPEYVRPASGRTWRFPLLSSQCASGFPPKGAAQLGRRDLNPRLHRFWRPALCQLSYVPPLFTYPKRNRPPGHLSWGRCRLAPSAGYMTGTVPLVAASIDWHGTESFPRSILGDQVFNEAPWR
jgi:hypothetical protein